MQHLRARSPNQCQTFSHCHHYFQRISARMLFPTPRMDYWPFLMLLFIWAMGHYQVVDGLFVTNIEVPEIVDYRARVTLSCSYNMSGHKLNSVKWYKDSEEFFRYSPMTPPTFSQFNVAGVTILSDNYFCNEITCSIDIGNLKVSSSGAYRCEVSGDAPAFKLTSRTANMTVAVLPQHDPLINGVNPTYRLNDFIIANCSSDWSSPAASLSWFINDEKASPDLLQPLQETTMTTNGFNLRLRSLELRFVFDKHRDMMYSRDVLKLKCVADINQIAFLRREKETTSYIIRDDNLRNSKLITSRNSAHLTQCKLEAVMYLIVTFIIINQTQLSLRINVPSR